MSCSLAGYTPQMAWGEHPATATVLTGIAMKFQSLARLLSQGTSVAVHRGMHRTWLLGVSLALAACADSPPDETTAPVDRPKPSPYEPTVETNEDSQLTVEQANAALPALLAQIVATDPEGIRDRFDALMVHADATCPPTTVSDIEGGTLTRWEAYGEGCTSADGTRFQGEVRYTAAETIEDGVPVVGWALDSLEFEVRTPSGDFMRGALSLGATTQERPDGLVIDTMAIRSQLEADATTAGDNPWLTGALNGEVALLAGRQGPGRLLQIRAVVKPGGGDAAVTATELDDVQLDNVSCPEGGLSGSVAMRDAVGGWHDVFFGTEDAPNCTACGELDFHGEAMGQLCLSSAQRTQLLTWETTPW